ncbi:diacylglycerol kinase [Thermosinus carboxydivorans Nor1]|uniref:Diacylglycerol kinase n=1 Tax=Thermosinus carboxydivorans Nor1 TaxID=401526 RepID=A1HPD1_9FIRM|nr:diacylglycerol kinase family protein [Thermosinus carboxydivorans]EAX48237.1 diacylglycerol kinase [Thermosinus carboxydivorans Nor1]
MRSKSLFASFRYALAGVLYCLATQRNMRIHFIAGAVVLLLAWRLQFSGTEMILLLLTVVAVLVAEMFNTAVEKVVDLASPHRHPLAKMAKDVAAGAVLVTALASVAVGFILFYPRLFR